MTMWVPKSSFGEPAHHHENPQLVSSATPSPSSSSPTGVRTKLIKLRRMLYRGTSAPVVVRAGGAGAPGNRPTCAPWRLQDRWGCRSVAIFERYLDAKITRVARGFRPGLSSGYELAAAKSQVKQVIDALLDELSRRGRAEGRASRGRHLPGRRHARMASGGRCG